MTITYSISKLYSSQEISWIYAPAPAIHCVMIVFHNPRKHSLGWGSFLQPRATSGEDSIVVCCDLHSNVVTMISHHFQQPGKSVLQFWIKWDWEVLDFVMLHFGLSGTTVSWCLCLVVPYSAVILAFRIKGPRLNDHSPQQLPLDSWYLWKFWPNILLRIFSNFWQDYIII